jgi:phosphatidate cytidylyltransferase
MKRVLTALVAIPIVLALTLFAPDWVFALSVGFVSALAAEEFMVLGAACGIGRPGKWFVLPVALVGASFMGGADWVLTSLGFSVVLLLTVIVFSGTPERALARGAIGLGAVLYCGFTLGFLVLLPRELVLLLFAVIWMGDSAAYYGGRAFGRRPLAPGISPKKTIEGAIAGLAGSMLIGGFVGVVFLGEPLSSVTLISGATAVIGQIGDLAESAMKRSAGVKDSSSILPGHGGILDRLDSLFFAAPVFYWLFNI